MIENSSIWVVSDVDGTLMDHSYDLSPARETIKNLQNIQIIGLGDSPNDLPLLLNSDIRVVIPGIDGPNLNLIDQLKDLEFTLASEPNGYGWKNEINKLINKRELS